MLKKNIVNQIAKAFATAFKPNIDSMTAATMASASIARAISKQSQDNAILAADLAVKTVAAIEYQVAAAAGRRGHECPDSWKDAIWAIKAAVRSINVARSPLSASVGVAGAFEGFL